MLYDKRWDKPEVKADPFSLESLIAWLETMPADGAYCYTAYGHCLLAQYFSAQGFEKVEIFSGGIWSHGDDRLCKYPIDFDVIALGNPYDRTFGAALKIARKALAIQS